MIIRISSNKFYCINHRFEPSLTHRFDICIPIQIKRRIKWLFYILNVLLRNFIVISKTMLSIVIHKYLDFLISILLLQINFEIFIFEMQ